MKVEVVETTLVPPSEATPRHALWLSNLDLAVPKTHTPLVYYYPRPEPAGAIDPERQRGALAQALVPFVTPRLADSPLADGGRSATALFHLLRDRGSSVAATCRSSSLPRPPRTAH